MVRTLAILTAAGSGTRLGHEQPKAFVRIGGVPLVIHAIQRLMGNVDGIVITVPPGMDGRMAALLNDADLSPVHMTPVDIVEGGPTRQASVAAGLAFAQGHPIIDVVLVHDAARPFAPPEMIRRVVDTVRAGHPAVVPVLAVTDTLKMVHSAATQGLERVVGTVDRDSLRSVQTPQGFDRAVLDRAHAAAAQHAHNEALAATDDAGLVEALGEPVVAVAGDARAMKITTAHDLQIAQALWQPRVEGMAPGTLVPLVGIGTDVHAYGGEDRELWLGGLYWPAERGLAGHSDADVAAHAGADALFSAAGLGDLGSNFGTDEPKWSGSSGSALLAEAARRVRAAGFEIGNIAVQVIGNKPRIGTRRHESQEVLGRAAGARVTLTATTTDGLGLSGRDEGIAAVATAVVYRVAGSTGM